MNIIEKDFPFELIDQIAERESYRKEINRPIYHIHKWWAKRLGSVFRAITIGANESNYNGFYKKFEPSNKIILDPFMGSGTTLGESVKLGYKAIGCDINPVSSYMVKQGLTWATKEELDKEFKKLEKDVSAKLKSYYKTEIPKESTKADVLYYFWVKVVTTPDGENIPLFKNYIFSKNAYPKRKPESKVVCPNCGEVFTCLYNSANEVCPSCKNKFDPQVGNVKGSLVLDSQGKSHKILNLVNQNTNPPDHKLYAILAVNKDGEKVYLKPSKFDFDLYKTACEDFEREKDNLIIPDQIVREGYNTNQARRFNYSRWSDFFNKRQLLGLGILYRRILEIPDQRIKEQFITLFSSTLEFNNLFCSFKGEGTGAVRHMFSNHILNPEKTPLENNIWGTSKSSGSFSKLYKSKLLKAKEYLETPFEIKLTKKDGKIISEKVVCSRKLRLSQAENFAELSEKDFLILNGNSSQLPIPDNSIDSIITDPPYFDFVHYSELSDFFYSWLRKGLSSNYNYFNKKDSSDKGEVQDRDADSFSYKIEQIFKEGFRVLKASGLLCFSFHHSNYKGWLSIYSALYNSNFEIVAAHPIKAEMGVATPKTASGNPINIDAILVCKKNEAPNCKGSEEIIKTAFSKTNNYIKRFEKIEREISKGDKFVILCSQILVECSTNNIPPEEAKLFLEKAIDNFTY
ncbi:DNA methyltransferase [Christiangramia sp. SM2212]|uniref:DNA methyltransferase n=1 Tax=Christiangramia sediminicola TaxID=3073267 RepID=A0ABU1EQX9_9FLAO|nr:DNA methyltransferase [Christiangramia sp. SM2212]MDR5590801.1 DNA methyltransferase [Christiangramia sp. SM2212]